MKLGKHPPEIDQRTLMFGKYLLPSLPPNPPAADYSKAVSKWGMMGNDQYGDCTCAAAGHMVLEWTANNGKALVISDSDILKAYNHFAHGNADAGANMLQVLRYWRKTGIGGDKISAFAALAARNLEQVKSSVELFGSCYIGVALPDFAVPATGDFLSIPWVLPASGPVGDAAPNPSNGHCIPAVGYDASNLYIVTWGAVKSMSWGFYQAYMDEAYAVLSADWLGSGAAAPNGFDLAALKKDLSAL